MLSLVSLNRLYSRSLNSGEAKVNRVNPYPRLKHYKSLSAGAWRGLSLKCMHVSHLCNNFKVTKIVY